MKSARRWRNSFGSCLARRPLDFVVVFAQQFFGVMEGVGAGATVV